MNFFFEHLLLRANLLISPATLLALEFSFLSDAAAGWTRRLTPTA
jgi:hypothetical protein